MLGRLRSFLWLPLLLAALAALDLVAPAQAQEWHYVPGLARDIGVGANGAVWIVSTEPAQGGYRVMRYDGQAWQPTDVAAARIAVAPTGEPWVVDDRGRIFKLSVDGLVAARLKGRARDIGVGADGSVWIIGGDAAPGGHVIQRWSAGRWTKIPGGAVRISVDQAGNAWVVNDTNNIFRYDGSKFVLLPGMAIDIGAGADSAVWAIGTDNGIYRFEKDNWVKKSGGAAEVAAGAGGVVWVVNQGNEIYKAQLAPPPIVMTTFPTVMAVPAPNTTAPPASAPAPAPGGPPPGAIAVAPGAMGPVITSSSPAPASAASGLPMRDDKPWRVFPRGGGYEAEILKAIRFQDFPNRVFVGGRAPAASTLSPLERAVADIALTATEAQFAHRPLPPDQELALVRSDAIVRQAVITGAGLGIAARIKTSQRDAETMALRQWASEVYRLVKIKVAKRMLDEYRVWKNDPCTYERLAPTQCRGIASLISPPKPSQELIAKNAMGAVLASQADEIASASAIGLGALAMGASGGAMASGLGVATTMAIGHGFTGGVTLTVKSSLYGAFGGVIDKAGTTVLATADKTAATAAARAIGSVTWGGVVAAPVSAAVMVVIVGTIEGVAVAEGSRVEPTLKYKLGSAMSGAINIENELAEENAVNFFFWAYQAAAFAGFYPPQNTIDGEVRYFCQAGYVCRFKLAYDLNGAAQAMTTRDLPVGHEQSFVIPYRAKNIVASGEWFDGGAWKSIFEKTLARPTYIGFTAYGTIASRQYKEQYPELLNMQAPENKLVVTHGGGYVAWIRVTYTENGAQSTPVEVKNATLGWTQEVKLPLNARDIRVQAWADTGVAWDAWKQIIDKTWPAPQGACVKIYNTTQDPKWNNACE